MSESPERPQPRDGEYSYFAFISYSHQDNRGRRALDPIDTPKRMLWGNWLHKALETYRVPRPFRGQLNNRGESIPARLSRCFRDEAELPAEARMKPPIEKALCESRFLIVICSPRSAHSMYVGAEVTFFKKLGRADRILPLIVAGEPNASKNGHKYGFGPEDECFGPPLKHPLKPDGTLDEKADEEPICADARWGEARREMWANEQRLARSTLDAALLKLIAGMLGVGFDDLVQRERQRQIRGRLVVAAVITGVLTINTSFALIASRQRNIANVQRSLAKQSEHEAITQRNAADAARKTAEDEATRRQGLLREAARSDRLNALDLFDKGRPRDAFAYLARALRYDPGDELAAQMAVYGMNSHAEPLPVRVLKGHAAAITAARFSGDGRIIATASRDRSIRLWEAATGHLLGTLEGHEGPVTTLDFSPDGTRLVTGSTDETAKIWDATTRKLVTTLAGHFGAVNSARFSFDGTRIVTAAEHQTAAIWDALTGHLLVTIGKDKNDGPVTLAQFNPNATRIVTASWNGTAVWETATGKLIARMEGTANEVTNVEFSPDGRRVVVGSQPIFGFEDDTAQVCDSSTGKLISKLEHGRAVPVIHYSPDGAYIVTGCLDNSARIWEASYRKLLSVLKGHSGVITDAQFSADGSFVATASVDKTARIWAVDTDTLVATATLSGHTSAVTAVSFSPDRKLVVTASGETARLWDSTGLNLVATMPGLVGARFNDDGSRMVVATENHSALVCEGASGRTLLTLPNRSGIFSDAHFAPAELKILMIDGLRATVWDGINGHVLASLKGHAYSLTAAEFSRDGKRIVTAAHDKQACLWDSATGKLLYTLEGHDDAILKAHFSADGDRVITASSDKTARVWTSTGKLLATCTGHTGRVVDAQFSADGKTVVTASDDCTARVWNATDGTSLALLQGHTWPVTEARFSPNGVLIATASVDRTGRIWEATSGKLVAVLGPHEKGVNTIRFSPEGEQVVTASDDQTACVWETAHGKLLAVLPSPEAAVIAADFVPDGTRIVTAAYRSEAGLWTPSKSLVRIWEAPPAGVAPLWFRDFIECMAQRRLNADGELEDISDTLLPENRENLEAVAASDPSRYAQIARWFLTPEQIRPVRPSSTVTRSAAADAMISPSASAPQLARALTFDPAHVLLPLARIIQERYSLVPPRGTRSQYIATYTYEALRHAEHLPNPPTASLWARGGLLLAEFRSTMQIDSRSGKIPAAQAALFAAGKALELDPHSLLALRAKARALTRLGRMVPALSAYRELCAEPAASADDFSESALFAARSHDEGAAFGFIEQGRRVHGDVLSLLLGEGWCRIQLDQPARAVKLFTDFQTTGPDGYPLPDDILIGLAIAQWLAKDHGAAIDTYRRLIDTSKDWTNEYALVDRLWLHPDFELLKTIRDATLVKYPFDR